jgi:hypothetical protein
MTWLLALAVIGLLVGNQMVNWGSVEIQENPRGSAEEEKGRRFRQRGNIVCLSAGVLLVIAILGLI